MKKIRNIIITLIILIVLGIGIYKVFLDCNKVISKFDREFTLEVMDYAHVDGEVYVKLLGIDDNRCLEVACVREGEQVAKVLVVNDMHIKYVKLGTLADNVVEIEDTDYTLELIEVSSDNTSATLKLTVDE